MIRMTLSDSEDRPSPYQYSFYKKFAELVAILNKFNGKKCHIIAIIVLIISTGKGNCCCIIKFIFYIL